MNEEPSTMTPMPSKTEHELEELLRAATPLPWSLIGQHIVKGLHSVARAESDGGDPIHGELTDEQMEDEELANSALIVAAVNALPALLAERKRLREGLQHLIDHAERYGLPDEHGEPGEGDWSHLRETIAKARSLLAEQEATDDDPISDSRQPEDGPPPGRWPR